MNIRQPYFRLLMLMLCISMLMLRLGGAHIHLCLDGSEAPSAVHYDDHDADHEHADEHEQAGHHDVNIDLSDSTLVKKTSTGMDLLTLLFVAALMLALPRDNLIKLKRWLDAAPFIHDVFHLRPPSRGPPRLPCVLLKH